MSNSLLEDFVNNLSNYLIGDIENDSNIIRKHTKKLETLGDISLPLSVINWHHLLGTHKLNDNASIFDYLHPGMPLDDQVDSLKEHSKNWTLSISRYKRSGNDLTIFLDRTITHKNCLIDIIKNPNYGTLNLLPKTLNISTDETILDKKEDTMNLTELRLNILYKVAKNLIKQCTNQTDTTKSQSIFFSLKSTTNTPFVLCGPVLNIKNQKDCQTAAEELFRERKDDMRSSAQHRFHISIKSTDAVNTYFEKLGKAAVTIEMLSVKPQKATKLSSVERNSTNKGPAFIFYNCARLSVLFKEFNKRVAARLYPELPDIENIDFSVLKQPEEWELLYVYILQYPIVVKSCIKDIAKGHYNPQNLVQFLSNMTSLFSVYYRRCRVLVDARDHLFAQIHARIYLLKALQIVFHNALKLLDIDPIKEM